jgi:hypothetical protein
MEQVMEMIVEFATGKSLQLDADQTLAARALQLVDGYTATSLCFIDPQDDGNCLMVAGGYENRFVASIKLGGDVYNFVRKHGADGDVQVFSDSNKAEDPWRPAGWVCSGQDCWKIIKHFMQFSSLPTEFKWK